MARSTKIVVAVAAALSLAACSSTVQVSSTKTLGGGSASSDGLAPASSGAVSSAPVESSSAPKGSVSLPRTSAPSEGASVAAPSRAASASAAARETGPIQLGVILTGTGNAATQGISTGETYSEKQIDQSLFAAINKQGGLGGRKLEAVFASTDTGSSNWSSDFAAACATFTQDHHVAAVVGYQFTYDTAFESCLTKKSVPHLTTGFNIPDASELSKHPLHRSLAVPTIDSRSLAKLQGAIADGVLTPKSRLGVILDACPGTMSSWTRVVKPYLVKHGINVVMEFASTCGTGNNADQANAIAGVASGLLKAKQARVDTFSFLTTSEGPALLVVAQAAEAQGWRPRFITSSLANLSTLEGQVPKAQLANVTSYGWMPAQDVAAGRQPARTRGQERCLQLLASQQVRPAAFGDLNHAYSICDGVFAYLAAYDKDGGTTAGAALISALDHLGTSFSSPDVLDGATDFRPGRENVAPGHYRSVVWGAACSCFAYKGPARAFP